MIKQVIVDTTGGKAVGPVIPIEVMTTAQAAGMSIEGKLLRVVQVTDADIAAGRAKAVGGRPIPVVVGTAGLDSVGGPIQQVYVVSGSLDPSMIYTNKVLALNPIAYWPMAESSGSVALDASGNGRNGAYTGVTLGNAGIGDGRTSARFDGATSKNNIFSTSLQSAFNSAEGTIALWAQVSGVGVWSDGVARRFITLQVDASNRVYIEKPAASNTFSGIYVAGGTTKAASRTTSTVAWFYVALTWSKSADQVKLYFNGVQEGATLTGLGTWVGSIVSTNSNIGANASTPTSVWNGLLAHAAIWPTPLSAAQILSLATVP